MISQFFPTLCGLLKICKLQIDTLLHDSEKKRQSTFNKQPGQGENFWNIEVVTLVGITLR